MSPPSPHTVRVACVAALTIATGAGAAAVAVAAKPSSGGWIGTNGTEFEVRGGVIKQFEHRCGPPIMGVSVIKVRADGRFSFDKRVSQPDGSKRRYRISGRFTSAFDASGRVTSLLCTAKFVARAQAAPELKPAPEPQPVPDPVAPE